MFHILNETECILNSNNCDAIVSVTNCHCKKTPFEKNFNAKAFVKEDTYANAFLQSIDGNSLLYDTPHKCYLKFRYPTLFSHIFWVGREIELYEKNFFIGTIKIEEIKKLNLDRNIKYNDQENILKNEKILNIALKRSLEWGKKYMDPLDSKLMRSTRNLSGNDIQKVVEYITYVSEYIFDEIYYDNWNSCSQRFKIDCQKAVIEKYPWINKSNLISLDSQGWYYASK